MAHHGLRELARRRSSEMIEELHALVSCESPSDSPAALAKCADLLAPWGDEATGRPARRLEVDGVPHLLWEADEPQALLLGHFDTVWPMGTIASWPMTVRDGVARGPGVFDMKAGIVQMFAALRLAADPARVSVLLTGDEETGSATSRELIEAQARRCPAVLVCEPSGDGGAVKVARKGVAWYRVEVSGRAAHAGLEPELGVNAGLELARQVVALETLGSPALGTTVTPTVLQAGTTANTVPESAVMHVDARAWSRDELNRVDAAMQGLRPHLDEAVLTVFGGVNRYPLEPSLSRMLMEAVTTAAADVGLPPPAGARAGGASDGNITAGVGAPTLDGLGPLGAHPHGRGERVEVDPMPDRVALLAALLNRLT
ncbi:MAG: M20 family metallopeptidase [Micromonosporaceae bacterium]